MRRLALWAALALLLVGVPLIPGDVVNGQNQPGVDPDSQFLDLFVPPGRELLRPFASAREAIAENRFSDAVRSLGAILDAPEDFFFQPDPSDPKYRSLKGEARRLIGELPPAGREAYELAFGRRAEQALAEAVAAGEVEQIAEVSRRFFHTKAGAEATYLLGTIQADQGEPVAAALCLERLQSTPALAAAHQPALTLRIAACWAQAGQPDKARPYLESLRQKNPDGTIAAGSRDIPLIGDSASIDPSWLATLQADAQGGGSGLPEWTMFRGSASRNAASLGSSPLLNPRWRVPTTNDPDVAKIIDQLEEGYSGKDQVALPALHPLAVGGTVLVRTTTQLLAIDFRTGKRRWAVGSQSGIDQMLETSGGRSLAGGGGSIALGGLDQRLWDDCTYGTLASDGELVFSVEDLELNSGAAYMGMMGGVGRRMVIMPNGRRRNATPEAPISYNRLAAHDIRTGKIRWELGGPRGESELELAGTFFLGAPLPMDGKLFALGEASGEIRLFVLDGDTGRVDWSQQLIAVDRSIEFDPLRLVAGASPTYAEGLILCPTASGALVAFDLTSRTLAWANRYPRTIDPGAGKFPFGFAGVQGMPGRSGERWSDASVTVAGDRVIVTPPESDEIYCHNLVDGTLIWNRPRDESLYVGCVEGGIVLLIGRSHLRALNLADGSPSWADEVVSLPAGGNTSGRGFHSAGRFYLPLSSAEVAAIEIATGQIVSKSKSRRNAPPGNLICYGGAVISQGVHEIESFYQLEEVDRQIAATLADNPQDATALALRGEVLLLDGRLDEAIADLNGAFAIRPDPRTREMLVEAMLDRLRFNFADYQATAAELEGLIERPEQHSAYLRVMARGWQQAGKPSQALTAYLELAALPVADPNELEHLDSSLSVRRDRWIQASLDELLTAAQADEREKIDRAIQDRLTSIAETESIDELRTALGFFGNHPAAVPLWSRLAERLERADAPLDAELVLVRLGGDLSLSDSRLGGSLALPDQPASPDQPALPETAEAVARLALLLEARARPAEAAAIFRLLDRELADQVCLDGKTGRQLVDGLDLESPIRHALAPVDSWPRGLVEVTQDPQIASGLRRFGFDFMGRRTPFWTDCQLQLDQQAGTIVAQDGAGQVLWQVSQAELGQSRNMPSMPTMFQARAAGHLVVLSTGYQVHAIDTLSAGDGGSARVLWTHNLIDALPQQARVGINVNQQTVRTRWGGTVTRWIDPNGQPLGGVGPVTASYVAFHQGRDLVAVDPTTGDRLWIRHDLAPGSETWGDEELLFVAAPNSAEAIVLRALDGHELGTVPVAVRDDRMATMGRLVLSWTLKGGKSRLTLADPWQKTEVWAYDHDPVAKADLIDHELVGVMDPEGNFTLRNIADGVPVVECQVDQQPGLADIHLMRSFDRHVLVVNGPTNPRAGVSIQPVPSGQVKSQLINGRAHGFDRETGKYLWSTEIDGQGYCADQPAQLPVLVLASQRHERIRRGGQNRAVTAKTTGSILCIDKRDGRRLIDVADLGGPITNFDVAADLATKSIEVKTLRGTHRLLFTDQPQPVEPPEGEQEVEAEAEETAEGETEKAADEEESAETPGEEEQE